MWNHKQAAYIHYHYKLQVTSMDYYRDRASPDCFDPKRISPRKHNAPMPLSYWSPISSHVPTSSNQRKGTLCTLVVYR